MKRQGDFSSVQKKSVWRRETEWKNHNLWCEEHKILKRSARIHTPLDIKVCRRDRQTETGERNKDDRLEWRDKNKKNSRQKPELNWTVLSHSARNEKRKEVAWVNVFFPFLSCCLLLFHAWDSARFSSFPFLVYRVFSCNLLLFPSFFRICLILGSITFVLFFMYLSPLTYTLAWTVTAASPAA